ncbi:hypothetical protein L4F91_01660 [Avibacterium sp. 20-126]|uniref:hypothetical protein n=1 Tax=Avibacterium sp. 20-126 TaxID=2911524 RepID=UPI0021869135|nr:hypothetical protein L4F91_01660 [Avibacterium sp. 20-126]
MTNKKNTIIIYIFMLVTFVGAIIGIFYDFLSTAICCLMSFIAIFSPYIKYWRKLFYSIFFLLILALAVVIFITPSLCDENALSAKLFSFRKDQVDMFLSGIIIPLLYILFSNRISNALKAVLREERKKLKNNNAARK